jgi:integrase
MAKSSKRIKLTDAAVSRIKPPPSGRDEYSDSVLPGFRLRVTETGIKSFSLVTRYGDNQVRVNCGRFPVVSLAEARQAARDALAAIAQGEDPREVRRQRMARTGNLVEDVVADFMTRHVDRNTRPNSAADTRRKFDTYVLPRWRGRTVQSITRRDVLNLLDDIVDEGKTIAANRVLASVRKFFNWALERDILDASPAAAVKAPTKEYDRDRVLTDDELINIWNGCDEMGYPFGLFIRMLLATAQRRNEVAMMRWSDIDLETGVWTLPREIVKADRSHEVPLSSLAIAILKSIPEIDDFVFSSGRKAGRPISGFSRAKKRIDKLSAVENWRIHDLRRSAASNMARLGVAPFTISRVLNHAEGGVTRSAMRWNDGRVGSTTSSRRRPKM